jgi:O-antigen ligase
MKSSLWDRETVQSNKFRSFMLPLGVGMLILLLGMAMGIFSTYAFAITIGTCALAIILLLRQDELAAVCILIVHLYVDWYLGLLLVGPLLTCILLIFFFLARSPQYPWSKPRALWLWAMFLILAIYPAFHGSLSRYDAAYYYPNVMLGAFLTFWLGIIVARDIEHTRRFFRILAAAGALLAAITIIQYKTGVLIFGTSRYDASLASASDFNIFQGSNVYRLGSFFVNPDWNGAFFATILYIPFSLFMASKSWQGKMLYIVETIVILPALLFTYSVGSLVSAGVGLGIFTILAGRMSQRIGLVLFSIATTITILMSFPEEIALLMQHGSDPSGLLIRSGAWQTAIRVIEAFPLTGVGLGIQAYMLRAEPYRVPQQYIILAHPHESYLELAAMAGLPELITFVALIVFALGLALHNWLATDMKQRALLAGGIAAVITLSVNSLSVNVWTLPPLSALGWLILGCIASPLLAERLKSQQNKNSAKP